MKALVFLLTSFFSLHLEAATKRGAAGGPPSELSPSTESDLMEKFEDAKTKGNASIERKAVISDIRKKGGFISAEDYRHLKGTSYFQATGAEWFHQRGILGEGVTIGACEMTDIILHPDVKKYIETLSSNILPSSNDPDRIAHASAVASIIHQISPKSRLIVDKYIGNFPEDVKIINLSFRLSDDISLESYLLTYMPDALKKDEKKPLIVKSAGNMAQNLSKHPTTKDISEECLQYVIFAGNLLQNSDRASSSGIPGDNPAIEARFLWTIGTDLRNASGPAGEPSYQYENGTSFSAAAVSGGAALIKSAFPTLRMDEVAECLLESADQDFFISDKDGNIATHVSSSMTSVQRGVEVVAFDPSVWGKGILNLRNAYVYATIKNEKPSLSPVEIRKNMEEAIQSDKNGKAMKIGRWWKGKKEITPQRPKRLIIDPFLPNRSYKEPYETKEFREAIGVPYIKWKEFLNEAETKLLPKRTRDTILARITEGPPYILIPEALLSKDNSQRESLEKFFKEHPTCIALFDLNPSETVLSLSKENISTIQHLKLTNTSQNITTIDNNFLAQSSYLETLDLRGFHAVTTIGDSFLKGCYRLTSLDLSSFQNVTHIGDSFLMECYNLTSLDLSSFQNVTHIGDSFLIDCYRLTSLDLSSFQNVTHIGDSFLMECHDLTSLDLTPLKKVIRIGNSFLRGCYRLTSLDLSSFQNVTHIGDSFLMECYNLTSLDLTPLKKVISIGNFFLEQCYPLESLRKIIETRGGPLAYTHSLNASTLPPSSSASEVVAAAATVKTPTPDPVTSSSNAPGKSVKELAALFEKKRIIQVGKPTQ